jgi:predicted DNA-binding transcriptional regulator YafY
MSSPHGSPATAPPRSAKTQRWVDLLAALLVRRTPATFEELAPSVAAYAVPGKTKEALMRMFERDKDELRAMGVPIETAPIGDGEVVGYRLASQRFYLPYLTIRSEAPRRVPYFGYHSLDVVPFDPLELEAIADAAREVRAGRDWMLADEVACAIRKLAVDLPVGGVLDEQLRRTGESPAPTAARAAPAPAMAAPPELVADRRAHEPLLGRLFAAAGSLFRRDGPPSDGEPDRREPEPPADPLDLISEALARRKAVSFEHADAPHRGSGRRTVEPYGLYFADGEWRVAGRDRGEHAVGDYRVRDMAGVRLASPAGGWDYVIPADFNLRVHARARGAGAQETDA